MRWSFSASRSFARCPRQYYYGQIAAEDKMYRSVCDIRAVAGDAKYADVDISDFPLTRNAKNCAFCPFQTLCSEQLRAANDDTMDLFSLAANG